MAKEEEGLTMGVQEEDAQVEPVLPEPFLEPWLFTGSGVCREMLVLKKGHKEG